jgi:hypothetical protein
MKLMITVLLLLLFITLQSCSTKTTSSESSKDNTKDSPPQSKLYKDNNDLPPGTADIKAEILSFNDSTNNLKTRLKIENVYNYGPATPPLAIGSEIICDIPQSVLNDINTIPSEKFIKGSSFKFIIKHQFGIYNKDNISNWRIISFK